MPTKKRRESPAGIFAEAFTRSVAAQPPGRLILKLYVSGMTPRSRRAIANLRELCERYLAGNYDLDIIDIYQQPALAKEAQIIAAPTLVKTLPPPLRRVIGDLGDLGRTLLVLGVVPKKRVQK